MRRRLLIMMSRLALFGFMVLMRGSSILENGISPTATMRLTATPVQLDAHDPTRVQVGQLTYEGGWILHADVPQFGGISSLSVEGDHFTGLSDTGAVAMWRFDGRGQPTEAHIKPLPPGCLFGVDKSDRDSESMVHDMVSGRIWVGLEDRSRVCRYAPDFARVEAMNIVPQMKHWDKNGGPESMVRLSDGRFIIIAEDKPRNEASRPLLIFDRDPTDPAVHVTKMYYDPPDDYSVSDMGQLPDGRIVVLNRTFDAPLYLFRVIVSIIEPFAVKPGGHVKSRVIARFDPPVVTDNYEALTITTEHGVPIFWIMSDDNYMDFQRTYLLKFAFKD